MEVWNSHPGVPPLNFQKIVTIKVNSVNDYQLRKNYFVFTPEISKSIGNIF